MKMGRRSTSRSHLFAFRGRSSVPCSMMFCHSSESGHQDLASAMKDWLWELNYRPQAHVAVIPCHRFLLYIEAYVTSINVNVMDE